MDLKQQLNAAREAYVAAMNSLNVLEKLYNETIAEPARRELLGKCFKCRRRLDNAGEGWSYLRVHSLEGEYLIAIVIDQNSHGRCRVVEISLEYPLAAHHVPISMTEYCEAIEPILNTIKERTGL